MYEFVSDARPISYQLKEHKCTEMFIHKTSEEGMWQETIFGGG